MVKPTIQKNLPFLILSILLGMIGFVAYASSKFLAGKGIIFVTAIGLLGCLVTLVVLVIRAKSLPAIAVSIVSVFIATAIGSYVILFGIVFFFQDFIANETSSFFQPKLLSAEAAQALISPQIETIDLPTPDGARLRGWLIRNSNSTKAPLLIYFDGSGSESSKMIPYAQKLLGWSVALINYRGFGLSEGTPSQAHVFDDAVLLYDTFSKRPDVDAKHIVAMGYSLGTGVAVYLSEQRSVAGTILVAPYDSMTLIGVKQPGVYAPLTSILKHFFDSATRAPLIHTPLLCLIGTNDQSIPNELSLKLVERWSGETTLRTYQGEDHDLLQHENNSWSDITSFLQGIQKE